MNYDTQVNLTLKGKQSFPKIIITEDSQVVDLVYKQIPCFGSKNM